MSNNNFFPQNILILCMFLMIFILSMNFIHPVYMIITLILYTMMICIIMSMWKPNFIYSIMMFLIMISGLLIIFLYFANLISNEKNKIFMNNFLVMSLLMNFIYLLYSMLLPPQNNLSSNIIHKSLETSPLLTLNAPLFKNIMVIYKFPNLNTTLLSVFFLWISLILIIKMSSIKSASFRKIK